MILALERLEFGGWAGIVILGAVGIAVIFAIRKLYKDLNKK